MSIFLELFDNDHFLMNPFGISSIFEFLDKQCHVVEDHVEVPAQGDVLKHEKTVTEAVSVSAPSTEAPAVDTETIKRKETTSAPAPVDAEAPVEFTVTTVTEEVVIQPVENVFLWGVPLLHTMGDECTNVILLKFLRARDLKVSEAFTMLKNTILWRKRFGADNILEEYVLVQFGGLSRENDAEFSVADGGVSELFIKPEGLNARQVAAELEAGIEIERGNDGSFLRESISTTVKKAMAGEEGKKLRSNAAKARDIIAANKQSSYIHDFLQKLEQSAEAYQKKKSL